MPKNLTRFFLWLYLSYSSEPRDHYLLSDESHYRSGNWHDSYDHYQSIRLCNKSDDTTSRISYIGMHE